MVLGVGMLCAQDYPIKPIRIVTSGLGGANDIAARFLAQGLTVSMGQSVLVENQGSGVIAAETPTGSFRTRMRRSGVGAGMVSP